MDIDIIVKVIIPVLGAIVTYILVPFIKSKTTKEQRENIFFWVKVAVGAAEQIFNKKGQGIQKKDYVIKFLTSKGIDITRKELDVLIEAAVKELNIVQEKPKPA